MDQLREEIRGQEAALDGVETNLKLGRWRPANRTPGSRLTRPMVTLVMHGPPGVGKTETALILAEALLGSRAALLRIDCSEMKSEHDTARLTGAPPGYVGYSDGSALSEALERDCAVILFDEFDRAHPSLNETLLGILDAGRLTDGRGRTATFENALLLFTTNLGFREKEGSSSSQDYSLDRNAFVKNSERRLEEKIKYGNYERVEPGEPVRVGSPALWSRLQGSLVGYDRLRTPAVEEIVRVSCKRLTTNLGDEFAIRLSLEAEEFAAAVGQKARPHWDGRRVFREVQRLIEGRIREDLAEMSEQDRLPGGAELRFAPDEDAWAHRV